MKDEQEPTKIVDGSAMDGDVFTHPAYGQIGAYRTTGGGRTLYGSDLRHQNYMVITIRRSELHRSLSRDWHMGRNELIEISLSEAQWATFVSTPNSGLGVTCTLDRVAGEPEIPNIPRRREVEVAKDELYERTKKMAAKVTDTIADVQGEIGSSLSKKRREAIIKRLRKLEQDLGANVPYYVEQFEEHMEGVVEDAKIEANAYVQNIVQRAGLDALGGAMPLQLESGEEDAGQDGEETQTALPES